MCARHFPDSPPDRLRWAIEESLVIAGIFLFWLAVAFVLVFGFAIVRAALSLLQLRETRFLYEFLERSDMFWAAITELAFVTAALYVLVRAGSVIVDRYLERRA